MKALYVTSLIHDPYTNLAYEDWMLDQIASDEILFFLWQNQHTVVIGKNQNAYKEAQVSALEENGGKLARRSSGGGAVYHDLGNLNFTFIAPSDAYDVFKQLKVIITALNKLGIEATFVGRNDIEVDGYKISGNAFAKRSNNSLHHGTLLVNVAMNELTKYLNVSKAKMNAKGVDSVRKRVANLVQFNPDLTIDNLKESLKISFEEVYQLPLLEKNMDITAIEPLRAKYASDAWRLNPLATFTAQVETKFPWGEIQAFFTTQNGIITQSLIFSDAMAPEFIEQLVLCWENTPYNYQAMKHAASSLELWQAYIDDILVECFEVGESA